MDPKNNNQRKRWNRQIESWLASIELLTIQPDSLLLVHYDAEQFSDSQSRQIFNAFKDAVDNRFPGVGMLVVPLQAQVKFEDIPIAQLNKLGWYKLELGGKKNKNGEEPDPS